MLTNGLVEKVYRAFLQSARHEVVVGIAGDGYDWQVHSPALHDLHKSESADHRQMQVEDQARSRARLVAAQKGRRTIEFADRQAVTFEKQLQRIPECRIVVDHVDDVVLRIAHNIESKKADHAILARAT